MKQKPFQPTDNILACQERLPMYDMIIKNGMVIDPSQNIDDQCDIAISQGKIATIETHINSQATKIINANNQYVTRARYSCVLTVMVK